VTIITRPDSTSPHPEELNVVRTDYTVETLAEVLRGHDAVISAVGVAGITKQQDMIDAAVAAGVARFVLSEFGYQPNHDHLPEFEAVGKPRWAIVEYAREKAAANPGFTWSGVAIGNPIDWVCLFPFPALEKKLQSDAC